MEEKTYTIDEVIALTINKLNAIRLPIALYDSVGLPIRQSIGNLEICLQMMKEPKNNAEQKEDPPTEVTDDGREADPE